MKRLIAFMVVAGLILIANQSFAEPLSERVWGMDMAYFSKYDHPSMDKAANTGYVGGMFRFTLYATTQENLVKSVKFTHKPTGTSYVVKSPHHMPTWYPVPLLYQINFGINADEALGEWKVVIKYTDGVEEKPYTLTAEKFIYVPKPEGYRVFVNEDSGTIKVQWRASCGLPISDYPETNAAYVVRIWEGSELKAEFREPEYLPFENLISFIIPDDYRGYVARLENRLGGTGAALPWGHTTSMAMLYVKLP